MRLTALEAMTSARRELEEPGQASPNFGDIAREIRLVELRQAESGIRGQVLTDSVNGSDESR